MKFNVVHIQHKVLLYFDFFSNFMTLIDNELGFIITVKII